MKLKVSTKLIDINGLMFPDATLNAICKASRKIKPHIGALYLNIDSANWIYQNYSDPWINFIWDIEINNPITKPKLIEQIRDVVWSRGARDLAAKSFGMSFKSQEDSIKELEDKFGIMLTWKMPI